MPDFDDDDHLLQIENGIENKLHNFMTQGVRFVTDEEYQSQRKDSRMQNQAAKNMPDFMEDDHLVQQDF